MLIPVTAVIGASLAHDRVGDPRLEWETPDPELAQREYCRARPASRRESLLVELVEHHDPPRGMRGRKISKASRVGL